VNAHKTALSGAQALPLITFLLDRAASNVDEKTVASAVAFVEQLADEHTHIVLAQVLARLENVLAVPSPQLSVLHALLTVAGRLLLRPRVAAACCNKPHGARLLQAARQTLDAVAAEPCRGAALYVLLRLAHAQDAAALRLAAQPASWDLVCGALLRGSDAVLRTNALALLCAMLQGCEPAAVPWSKIVDALKAVVGGGETQQRLIAAHILVEGAQRGGGPGMLAKDVLLHALDALHRHELADALSRRLAQLVVMLGAGQDELFAAQLRDGLAGLCAVVERFLQAGTSECVGQSLELLTTILRHDVSEAVVRFARDALCSCADAIAHEVAGPCGVSWLQVTHLVLQAELFEQTAEFVGACSQVVSALVRLPAEVAVSAQHVALALSLSALLRDYDGAGQVARRHEVAVRESPFVCLELITVAVASTDAGFATLFPAVLASFFNARRTLQSSDPTMLSLCDGVLQWAKAAMPWWKPRLTRAQACMLRLPDPASWMEMMQSDVYVQDDQQLMALMLGLSCCAAVSGCDWQPLQGGVDALCDLAAARPEVAGVELAMLLCLQGWSECVGPLADAVARGIVAANVELTASMPPPFLAWAFGVRVLEPLVGSLVSVLVEQSALHTIVAGAASGAVAGHLVKLLARPGRTLNLLMTVDAFVRSGEEAVALFAVKGIVSVLQSTTWATHELEWLCGLVALLLKSNALPVQAAADLVFGSSWFGMVQVCSSETTLLAWYNAAALVLAQQPDEERRAGRTPTALQSVAPQCENVALIVAQLQVAGLCVSQWNQVLWQTCVGIASECEHTAAVSAALCVIRALLLVAGIGGGPSGDMMHEVWMVLQSLLVASSSDQLRRAVAKTVDTLVQRCGSDMATSLLALPWSGYTWRHVTAQLRGAVPGAAMSRGLISYVHFVLPFVSASVEPELVGRLTLECAVAADDFVPLGAVLTVLTLCKVDATGREAIRRAVMPKIQALSSSSSSRRDHFAQPSSTAVHSQMFGQLLLFPQLLWDDLVPPTAQMREDRLFRIQALLTK
jgi:hypothetical protein